ncbi:right-handed parallel beta-helix repeat-containing protein [Fodinicola feengrottensis]|uniref:right-handed parallel beta-helix repeat-containing protein n=1 Tax=Fodinicola feengrottensis TaxID=435914 RepID=UPI0013D66675|nr:right-handed parallel beta-helix repeat-containing protein [Fodinicola feengrottensis]
MVDGCDIHGTNARGTSADHEALTLGQGSSNLEVRNTKVHDNGEEGIDVKYDDNAQAKIHDNVVTGKPAPNIYVDGSSHVQIYNNVSTGTKNNTKAGIMLAVEECSSSRKTDDVQVYNNVLANNAAAGLDFWIESSGTISNIHAVNNTFYGNKKGAVGFDADSFGGQNILRNNVYAEGAVSHPSFASDHNLTGDPGFVNPQAGDFHLSDGSRPIDAGSATDAPAFDLENHPRPAGGAGYDIGAYER